MIDHLDWVAVARLRQGLYRFLGAGLLWPDQERIQSLLGAAEVLDSGGIEYFAFASAWDRLMDVLGDLPPAAQLEIEHTRLFSAGGGYTPCPPNESYYLGRPGSGDTAVIIGEIEREHRRLGLGPAPGSSLMADHAATELEVMSALCALEHSAWVDGALGAVADKQTTELDLLQRHLSRWFHLFAQRVAESSKEPYYTELTSTAAAFVHHDRELLLAVTRPNRHLESV